MRDHSSWPLQRRSRELTLCCWCWKQRTSVSSCTWKYMKLLSMCVTKLIFNVCEASLLEEDEEYLCALSPLKDTSRGHLKGRRREEATGILANSLWPREEQRNPLWEMYGSSEIPHDCSAAVCPLKWTSNVSVIQRFDIVQRRHKSHFICGVQSHLADIVQCKSLEPRFRKVSHVMC